MPIFRNLSMLPEIENFLVHNDFTPEEKVEVPDDIDWNDEALKYCQECFNNYDKFSEDMKQWLLEKVKMFLEENDILLLHAVTMDLN